MKTQLISLILLMSCTVFAQKSIDLANVYWRTSPFNSNDGSTDQRHLNMYVANLKLPVVLNDDNALIFGLEYQHNTITSSTSTSLIGFEFSSSMLQIGWEHKWNKKSKMLFMSMTRLNTDFANIDISHIQQGGLALGTTKRSENFAWKYGLYFNADFFGPMVVPLFGFNWKINEQWRFKMVIPVNLEIAYKPKDWFRTGLRFDGVNASYRTELIPGGFAGTTFYIDKADNNAWLFSEFHLGKNVWFHLKAGHSVIRKYRIYQSDDQMTFKLGPVNIGDNRLDTAPMFNDGWSFEARFIYRLPL